jgi:hypothetical protein
MIMRATFRSRDMATTPSGSSVGNGTAGNGRVTSETDLPVTEDGPKLDELRSRICVAVLCFSMYLISCPKQVRSTAVCGSSIMLDWTDLSAAVEVESAKDHSLSFLWAMVEVAASISSGGKEGQSLWMG